MSPILKIIISRLTMDFLTLLIVSELIFSAIELLPGDIATETLGQSATPETIAAFKERFNLNDPVHLRYLYWLRDALQGDFGISLSNQRRIAELIVVRAATTFFLAGYAALIAVPLALLLGMLAALHRNSAFDRGVSGATLAAISFPEFFVAYILVLVFSVLLGWFPSLSSVDADIGLGERLYRTFLPALTLTMIVVAHMMRMTRAAIINLLALPYIEMAHLKGMRRWRVIAIHALPNAVAPIINVVALNLAYLVVGVVLLIGLTALFAPLLASFPETEVVGPQYSPWAAPYYLGTDALGRDVLSRMIYGARNTVGIALLTTALAFLLGATFGLLAATLGGCFDMIGSRVVDVLMAIRSLIFELLVLPITGTSVVALILVIAVLDSTRVYRLSRAVAQGILTMDYVEVARMRGEGLFWIIRREVLPNAAAPLIAEFGLRFCFVFLFISALSFLGLGLHRRLPTGARWCAKAPS
ncbi:ABC transporter permease subunit [Defluviimonas sp. SAOS-178_SWC]|uniref:ABC transporter permease subunit n=1 Tax=Defluviimonas sp. SAOS-178_SWC TaxID=3121287 RepID=UPI003221A38B